MYKYYTYIIDKFWILYFIIILEGGFLYIEKVMNWLYTRAPYFKLSY